MLCLCLPIQRWFRLREVLSQEHALVIGNMVRLGLLECTGTRYEVDRVLETTAHLRRLFKGMSALSLTIFGCSWEKIGTWH
jgi:hypothetical protein